MKCYKCQEDFEERQLDCSHDIPKYMGGTDLDGRHWLCKSCHEKYEYSILKVCLDYLGQELKEGEEIVWMKELSKCDSRMKEKFREFAENVRVTFFRRDAK